MFALFVLFCLFSEWFKLLSALALVNFRPEIFKVLFSFRVFTTSVGIAFVAACVMAALMSRPRRRRD